MLQLKCSLGFGSSVKKGKELESWRAFLPERRRDADPEAYFSVCDELQAPVLTQPWKQAVINALFAHVTKIIFSCFIYRWSESPRIRVACSHLFFYFSFTKQITYIETSAKDPPMNVDKAFHELVRVIRWVDDPRN